MGFTLYSSLFLLFLYLLVFLATGINLALDVSGLRKILLKITSKLNKGILIRLFLELYLTLLISSWVQVQYIMQITSSVDIISCVLGVSGFILCVFCPIYFGYVIYSLKQ
jgi:hypothetical protein